MTGASTSQDQLPPAAGKEPGLMVHQLHAAKCQQPEQSWKQIFHPCPYIPSLIWMMSGFSDIRPD